MCVPCTYLRKQPCAQGLENTALHASRQCAPASRPLYCSKSEPRHQLAQVHPTLSLERGETAQVGGGDKARPPSWSGSPQEVWDSKRGGRPCHRLHQGRGLPVPSSGQSCPSGSPTRTQLPWQRGHGRLSALHPCPQQTAAAAPREAPAVVRRRADCHTACESHRLAAAPALSCSGTAGTRATRPALCEGQMGRVRLRRLLG